MKKHVAEIKRLIRERKEALDGFQALTRFLVSKGVTASLAERIGLELSERDLGELKECLVKKIRTAGELQFPSRIALVGPTGVGKTTTLLKLADFYKKQGKEVCIVALDREKAGALEQLEPFAFQKNIPLCTSIEEAEGELILIDTSGCNFYLPQRVDQLGEELASCGEVEITLTLSAAAKEVDLYGAIHQFSPLCPTSLAFTKLDETLAGGVLINVSAKCEIPIRYVAFGYPLPGEVRIANPHEIIHKILTEFNHTEFNHIRHLSLSG